MDRLKQDQVNRLVTQQTNMHGRAVVNASDAINAQDYTTLNQVKKIVNNSFITGPIKSNIIKQHKLTVAKITPGGTNGSITWNENGQIIAWVDPT